MERTDILAVGTHLADRPTIELQVKAANESGRNTTWILGSKAQISARSAREWFVLVFVPRDRGTPVHGCIVPRDHVAAAAWIVHQNWLTSPQVPPGTRNTPVSASRVNAAIWQRYEGRWDLLDLPTDEVSVLLPSRLRDWAGEERVGLPPLHPWRTAMTPDWR